MARHLQRCHSIMFKKKEYQQPKIAKYVNAEKSSIYNDEFVKRNLSLAIATSSAGISFIENEFLRKALANLKPDFKLPNRQNISSMIRNEAGKIRETLLDQIQKSEFISLAVDFWSANRLGYVGIVVQLIIDAKRINMLMALRYCPHPHTAETVLKVTDKILAEFGIEEGCRSDKIACISTDGGANMVKAYETLKYEDIDISNGDQPILTESEFESNGLEGEFDATENENVFGELSPSKRVYCVNHKLNLNLKNSFAKCIPIKCMIEEIVSKLTIIRNKSICNDYLKEKRLPKIKLPSRTRWLFHTEVFERLIELKDQMPTLCLKANVQLISLSDFEQISEILGILNVYKKLHLSMEKTDALLSSVIPSILNLSRYLVKFDSKHLEIKEFALELERDLKLRFRDIFDPSYMRFNIIYGIATYLDPQRKIIMNLHDCVKIKKLVIQKLNIEGKDSEIIYENVIQGPEYQYLQNELLVEEKGHREIEMYFFHFKIYFFQKI